MVETLLLRLKQHTGLAGRITAELLDDGDCVGEPRCGAMRLGWGGNAAAAVAVLQCCPDVKPPTVERPGVPLFPSFPASWQSERLGAVLFATADTLADLRRIDDALR